MPFFGDATACNCSHIHRFVWRESDGVLETTYSSFIFSGYLVDGRKNDYKIDFTRFKIRDINSGSVLFEIAKPEDEDMEDEIDYDECDPDSGRFVRYRFTDEFLRLKSVGATNQDGAHHQSQLQ